MQIDRVNRGSFFWRWLLCGFFLVLVFNTHPFLRLPYDPWEHLIKIRSLFDEGRCFLYWPEDHSSLCSWHYVWARLFSLAGIDDTFIWAYTIHYCQCLFSLFSLYYFSTTVYSLVHGNVSKGRLYLFGVGATLFWLVGNGTFSVAYQQAWIVWYSVTYQGLTIPLFWLITACTLQILFEENLKTVARWGLALFVVAGFLVIVAFHPTEAIYYLIYFLLALFFTPRLSRKWRMLGFGLLVIVGAAVVCVGIYINSPYFRGVRGLLDITVLGRVHALGVEIVAMNMERLKTVVSELAILALIVSFLSLVYVKSFLSYKLCGVVKVLLFAQLVFILIPTNSWVAGLLGTVIHKDIIWRFVFAGSWFLFLPYLLSRWFEKSNFYAPRFVLSLFSILLVAYVASYLLFNKTLYGNVISLYNSYFVEKVGLQYGKREIELLKEEIEESTSGMSKKQTVLYMRGDLATIARAVFGYYVFAHRRIFIPMHQFYGKGMQRRYELVPVRMPLGFPKDRDMFLRFYLDARFISTQRELAIEGDGKIEHRVDQMDLWENYLFVLGWAFVQGNEEESETFVVLRAASIDYVFDTSSMFRGDVGKAFGSHALENNGFLATIPTAEIKPGLYEIYLLVMQGGGKGYIFTGRKVSIGNHSS